jgi:hypothetical protein
VEEVSPGVVLVVAAAGAGKQSIFITNMFMRRYNDLESHWLYYIF